MANQVERDVELLVQRLLDESGGTLELVAVEYVKERDWYLRVYIDKPDGVEIDDCQALSQRLESELDRADLVPNSYILEVSSPGLDRVLKKPRDFERERGKAVEVSLYEPRDGQKQLVGVLTACDGQTLSLDTLSEPLPMNKVAQVRLHVEF